MIEAILAGIKPVSSAISGLFSLWKGFKESPRESRKDITVSVGLNHDDKFFVNVFNRDPEPVTIRSVRWISKKGGGSNWPMDFLWVRMGNQVARLHPEDRNSTDDPGCSSGVDMKLDSCQPHKGQYVEIGADVRNVLSYLPSVSLRMAKKVIFSLGVRVELSTGEVVRLWISENKSLAKRLFSNYQRNLGHLSKVNFNWRGPSGNPPIATGDTPITDSCEGYLSAPGGQAHPLATTYVFIRNRKALEKQCLPANRFWADCSEEWYVEFDEFHLHLHDRGMGSQLFYSTIRRLKEIFPEDTWIFGQIFSEEQNEVLRSGNIRIFEDGWFYALLGDVAVPEGHDDTISVFIPG